MTRARAALAAAVAAAALAPAALLASPASADRRMEVGVQDDPVFVDQSYYDRGRALEQAHALGATRLRANLIWATANPTQRSMRHKPRKVVYDWSRWDTLIDAAARDGIRVQLTLTGPAPAWATGDHREGVYAPSAHRFGSFVSAAVRHFKGRVNRYSIWNEPSHIGWLLPLDLSPGLYRELYLAGWSAAKRADRHSTVLLGEMVPFGSHIAYAPLRFLRDITCSRLVHPASRHRAPTLERGPCGGLHADGIAVHPYDYKHAPEAVYPDDDAVTIGTLWRLTGTLKTLARIGALSTPGGHALPAYLTEYGYFHSGAYRKPEATRAAYLPRAYSIAARTRGVKELVQYSLIAPPYGFTGAFFDLSLIGIDGNPFQSYDALSKWVAGAAASGRVARAGGPIKLPPARK